MYLIDGHNLIPKIPGMSLSRLDDERELIELLKTFCLSQQKDVEVFFDGAPPGFVRVERLGRLTVYYIRQGSTADNAIRDRLQQLDKKTRGVTVVSSDRQVQAEARNRRAAVLSSEAFAARLAVLSSPLVPPDHQEKSDDIKVQDWLELFGGEPKDNIVPESQYKRHRRKKKPGKAS